MKSSNLPQFLLILPSIVIIASGLSLSQLQQNGWPKFTPTLSSDGYYFDMSDGCLYNITTGQTWNANQLITVCENENYLVTNNLDFFCYAYARNGVEWYQFSFSNFSILNSFKFELPDKYIGFGQTDTYLTIVTADMNQKTITTDNFDLLNQKYVCNITQPGQDYAQNYVYTNYGLLYPSTSSKTEADFFPCTGNSSISSEISTMNTAFSQGFIVFNQSTIYLYRMWPS